MLLYILYSSVSLIDLLGTESNRKTVDDNNHLSVAVEQILKPLTGLFMLQNIEDMLLLYLFCNILPVTVHIQIIKHGIGTYCYIK